MPISRRVVQTGPIIALFLAGATTAPTRAQESPELTALTVAFLRKGPAWTDADTPEHADLQTRHQNYLLELAQRGDLVLAGPLDGYADPDLRGIVASNRLDAERLAALLAADPKIEAEHLRPEIFVWWVPSFQMPIAAPRLEPSGPLRSVALRVHRMEAMEQFYSSAFGAEFRTVQTGEFEARFARVGDVLLKLVPIRETADFAGFPVHQLGFEVESLERVLDHVDRLGGNRLGEPVLIDGVRQVAIRDPDGNTLELYEAASPDLGGSRQ